MDVLWSKRATSEFEAQIKWLEQHASHRQVSQYLLEVTEALEKITNPLAAYKLVRENPETRCYPVNKNLMVYYRPQPDFLILVSLFDTRQDPDKLRI